MRNRLVITIAIALLGASTVACEGRTSGFLTTGPTTGARVRVLNALTSAQSVDFLVDGQLVASTIPFAGASGYSSLPFGTHRLQIRASATGTSLIDFTRDLTIEGAFSLIPAPGLGQSGALLIPDDPTPVAGQARLRVVHVAAAPGPVSVYITAPTTDLPSTTPVVPTLAFGAVSAYVSVSPGTYRIRVTPLGSPGTLLLDTGGVTFGDGAVRTLLLTDAPGGGFPTSLSIVSDAN